MLEALIVQGANIRLLGQSPLRRCTRPSSGEQRQ